MVVFLKTGLPQFSSIRWRFSLMNHPAHLRNPPFNIYIYTWGFPKMKVPNNGWLISFAMENPMDDLGVPPLKWKPPVFFGRSSRSTLVRHPTLEWQLRRWDVPSGYVKIATEHGPLIVDLAIRDGDFPVRYVNVYQRIYVFVDWNHTNFLPKLTSHGRPNSEQSTRLTAYRVKNFQVWFGIPFTGFSLSLCSCLKSP